MTERRILAGRRTHCPRCRERIEADTMRCYCDELNRRAAYDAERARRGLAALYRPPSMR
jgi:hypothetical protein